MVAPKCTSKYPNASAQLEKMNNAVTRENPEREDLN
jgi:hypothetical protein